MTDYDAFSWSGVNYPLSSATTNTLLKDADPSLYYVLDFFQSVLNTHLSARITAEAARAPAIAAMTATVAAVCPLDPTPYLKEEQFKFPLLCVYRKKDQYIRKSSAVQSTVSEWGVDYILPPLTGGQMERMAPLLQAVGRVLMNRIENCMDPGYASGAAVWQLAGLDEIYLDEASIGAFAGTGNLVFPAWRGKLIVKDSDLNTITDDNFSDLTGVDTEEDLIDPAGIEDDFEHIVDTEITF